MLEINKIYCECCLITMSRIDGESIDLIITSPPYDNLRDYDGYNFNFNNIVKELFRIIKKGRCVVWVVGDAVVKGSETGTIFKQALYFKKIGFNLHDTMIYQKNSGIIYPSKNRYNQNFEYMFILSKGSPNCVNLIKEKKLGKYNSKKSEFMTYRQRDGSLVKKNIFSNSSWKIKSNIWKFSQGFLKTTTNKYAYEHPAMFPEKLARDHIISWSNKGDLVYDPMCGSGTVCKMAKLLGRNYIGSDISSKYVKIAEKRVIVTEPLF